MADMIFVKRLAQAMEEKGVKQVDLLRAAAAQGVKLGKSQMSQYVSGKAIPRENIGCFLAKTLDVTADWLYGRCAEKEKTDIKLQQSSFSNVQEIERNQTMREIKKSTKLDNVLYDVRGPVVDEANRMEENGTHVLKLNIGNPAPFGFRTPDEVVYDMQRQLTECEGYSAAKGLFSARKAIMQYSQLKKLPNVSIGDIYTGNLVSRHCRYGEEDYW